MFRAPCAIVTLVFMGFLMQGCKKDDPAPISCYITSLTELNGGFAYVRTYTYNVDNKVSGVSIVGGGSSTVIRYTYDADRKAVGATYTEGSLSATESYTYDGSRRHIGTVFTIGSSISNSNYTYNSSGQLVTATYTATDYAETDTFSYANTTTMNFSSLSYAYTTNGTTYTGSNSYEYDTKPNPLRLIPGNPAVAESNPTKRTSTIDGAITVTTYAYEYNEQGYPISAAVESNGLPSMHTLAYNCK